MLISGYPGMHKAYPTLYHTLDGGDHWTEILRWSETRGLGTEYKSGIEFRDADNGWIGTDPQITEGGYLYVSRDRGMTWQRQNLTPPAGMSRPFYVKVLPPKFFGARGGVCVALFNGATPVVYSTSDGGRSWANPRQIPTGSVWDFLSPTIWATASNQALWLSLDAGQNWSQHSIPLPPAYSINRLALASPTQVWLTGYNPELVRPLGSGRPIIDYVLETHDAGLHWTHVVLPQVH